VNAEQWHRLNEVVAEALEAPIAERASRIAQACGGDEALRTQALSMMTAAERSGDFLKTPALETLALEVAANGWSLRSGERVGAYRVEWLLGSGGSGEVWRAHDERLGRDVAIKVLLPHFASDVDRLRRFQQEARAAGALNHANILVVYDVGEHRGAPFLVSECLEGESLRKRLEAGSLSLDDSLGIGIQIARGLEAAHARGIIHRDLKPDNVFVRSDGGVKILDFGLAKLKMPGVEEPAQTITGVIAGTPGYMCPEQVRGQDVDTRADIFSLGAMLYEMLSGHRPFTGSSTIETLHAILTVEPPDLAIVRQDIPIAVSNIVQRCLEKAADKRVQSVNELVTALEAAAAARRALAAAESFSISGESAVGTRLGTYVIVAHLGRGSIGDVYRARDTRVHRDVVLEILSKLDGGDPKRLARLQNVGNALAVFNHPNLAATYGLEDVDGFHVLVVELVDGDSLSERIARSPLGLDEALSVAKQIAGALEALHERGVVPSDLSPSKVIMQPDGTVKLAMFGVADTSGRSDARVVYQSPEQARGKPIDRRADLWAFGCVLFEMLTGRAAFRVKGPVDDAAAVATHEPDFDALPSDTPFHVRALLARCLQRDPANRFRDAGDARLELEQPSDPAWSGVTKQHLRMRSSARLAWAVAVLAVLVAAGAMVGLLETARPNPSVGSRMRFSPVTNFAGVEAQPTLSPDGRSVAFVSNRSGQWDIYVGLVSGGNLVRITNDPNVEIWPRWSPDGTRLLFSRLNAKGLTDVWVVPALSGTARLVVSNAATAAWSHDSRAIAYRSGAAIWVSDADGGNPRAITQPEPAIIRHTQPAFSHSGRALVFVRQLGAQRGELAVADLKTGAVRNLTSDGALALCPVWSPDDRFIYFTSSRGGTLSIWKLDVSSGEAEPITAGQDDNEEIDLSADGKRLVFSSSRTNIGLAEMSIDPASRGQLRWLTTDAARGETAPRYSPDGKRIVYFTNRNSLEADKVWVMDADGSNANKIVEDGRINGFPRWTPDGLAILFGSRPDLGGAGLGPVELRRISLSGGAPEVLPVKPFDHGGGAVRGDGTVLVRTSLRAGEIYNPRTNDRQPVSNLPGEPWWSPDGESFAFAVSPSAQPSSDEGLWIGTIGGARRKVFPGWVMWFAFDHAGNVLVVEGKPDLKGVLWRLDPNSGQRTPVAEIPLLLRHAERTPARFDVHPDGRRIVLEARPVFESDIGVIDNLR
jgi:serine/threonine protein kinase/Tol biopolymer transport system component